MILSKQNDMVVASVRNYKSIQGNGIYGTLYKIAIKVLYNKSDIIVAVSEGVKQDLIDNFGINKEKLMVIYNPYDLEWIQKSSRENIEEEVDSKIFSQGKIILTAGRLHWQKGQWNLIKAFKMIKEKIIDAKLVILGEGPLENELKELSHKLGLSESIHFLGFKQNPFKYYSRADVFVLPSLVEGFPNVLVEAMACGAPVISTDCKSGPREILSPHLFLEKGYHGNLVESTYHAEYGVIVPTFDTLLEKGRGYYSFDYLNEERILGEAVIDLLLDKNIKLKYKEKSKIRAKEFSFEKAIDRWVELLNK